MDAVGMFFKLGNKWWLLLALIAVLALAACDRQRINKLEEGVSTEADVRSVFGEPEKIWDAPNGARLFEYNRQPAGHRNYMITIGPDGKMLALVQVLQPKYFAKIQPGMMMEDVRKLLGKPAKITPYALAKEVHYTWQYLENAQDEMVFTVVFDPDYRVKSTSMGVDPDGRNGVNRN